MRGNDARDQGFGMLPGGLSVTVAAPERFSPAVLLVLTVHAVRQVWPQCECEWAGPGEAFVYKDARTRDLWDRLGADPVCFATMVHVLARPGLVELVLDELTGDGGRIVEELRQTLYR